MPDPGLGGCGQVLLPMLGLGRWVHINFLIRVFQIKLRDSLVGNVEEYLTGQARVVVQARIMASGWSESCTGGIAKGS